MYVEVGQIQEEGSIPVVPEELDGVGEVPLGQRRLVGLLGNHVLVEHERERRARLEHRGVVG